MARGVTTASLTAQDTFSGWLLLQGKFNISASGFGTATVTLQRKFGASGTTLDIEQYTADTEKQAEEPEDQVYYRLGIKTGDYTSGTIAVRLSQ